MEIWLRMENKCLLFSFKILPSLLNVAMLTIIRPWEKYYISLKSQQNMNTNPNFPQTGTNMIKFHYCNQFGVITVSFFFT